MPDNQALQTFYGSIPVIVVLLSALLQMHRDFKVQTVLLQDILARISRIES
jgi:hypothetical protein